MAPTIVVLPAQNVTAWRDSECVDAVRGAMLATFLTGDLQQALGRALRVATTRRGWGLIGYSTGGFCAVDLALQRPYRYAAAASLSGYFVPLTDVTTGDLYRRSRTARRANDPMWLIRHRRLPGLAFYLACARPDHPSLNQLRAFVGAAGLPVETTVAILPTGGHNFTTWRTLEGPALDWLSAQLMPPLAGPQVAGAGRHSTRVSPA